MKDIAKRFTQNPLLSPADLPASREGLEITCLLNPGVFQFEGKTWLLVRVAERPEQKENIISFPILTETGTIKIIEIPKDDPELSATDASTSQKSAGKYNWGPSRPIVRYCERWV